MLLFTVLLNEFFFFFFLSFFAFFVSGPEHSDREGGNITGLSSTYRNRQPVTCSFT